MLNVLKSGQSNSIAVVVHLLKTLKVKANLSSIKLYLKSHPAFPSLLAISDYLTSISVENQTIQVKIEDCMLPDLTVPFIAHSLIDGGKFLLVHEVNEHHVRISDENHTNQILTVPEFIEIWKGVLLMVRRNENSGEMNYKQNLQTAFLKKTKLPIFVLSVLIILFFIFNQYVSQGFLITLLVIKFIGLLLSLVLLSYGINPANLLVKKVCGFGTDIGCHAILKSDAAKITAWLSWSEIGFFYFCGSFLTIITSSVSLHILQVLNIITLPFTVYSFTYQYQKKQWCKICITVQLLLIIEIAVFIIYNPIRLSFYLTFHHIIVIMVSFFLPLSTWYIIKPILIKAFLLEPVKRELNYFKYDTEIFKCLIKRQAFFPIETDLMLVSFGNTNFETKNVITIISSPNCEPCRKAHNFVERFINDRNNLTVQIFFLTSTRDNVRNQLFVEHLIALSLLANQKLTLIAMNEWYNKKNNDYSLWAQKYPVIISEEIHIAYTRQKKWLSQAAIIYTPTILLNGFQLPKFYQLEDIEFLLN